MAVSKRLRYEIFRRDNHACRYCGAAAPDAPLTVDHVVPVALGGADEPGNLVTACRDCNAGKSASSPDAPVVDDVAADALRWAAAMERAGALDRAERHDNDAFLGYFRDHIWGRWTMEDGTFIVALPGNWQASILNLRRAGIGHDDLEYATEAAMRASHIPTARVWRYFAGICWRTVERRREVAASLLQAEEAPGAP